MKKTPQLYKFSEIKHRLQTLEPGKSYIKPFVTSKVSDTIWDGGHKWVNSGSDFTSGNVVVKPGQARFVNILWGPAIGYGSYENFEYDANKDYFLRIAEPFGKLDLPLNLVVVP